MTKIVPNDMLNPTEKTIKNWNCSFIAVEGPNILDKVSLEDLEIPYESQYRSRIILKANEYNQPLIYGFIGKAVTFLMVKVTYDSENDPYYQYEQEKYNIQYYFENDPILRPLGRLLIMTGSVENRIPQIYLNNPLGYDVVLDVLHATLDTEYSGTTINEFGITDLSDVVFSGLTSGDTLMYNGTIWLNTPFNFNSGITGTSGSSGTNGSSGSSGTDGINGTSGINNSADNFGGNSILYKFNTNINENSPLSGYLKLNNISPSLATKLIVDYRDGYGNFVDTWLRSISINTSSYFRLYNKDDSSIFCIYKIIGGADFGIISKYFIFDIEIVYADDNKFFIFDDEVVLTYTESGTGSESITIPQLKLDTGYYTAEDIDIVKTDKIRCYWESADTNFLNYNPEVWIFRRKTYVREENNTNWKMRHRKWTHEPHLNGIKFGNSSYYSGSINCVVDEIRDVGRHTEFSLNSNVSGEKMIIPLDPYDYIYGSTSEGWVKLSDSTDYKKIDSIKITGRRNSRSLPLRFAIVIDNPDSSAKNPKIIGPLSDTVYLRYGRNGGNENIIKYFWNEIDIRFFGKDRW